MGCVLALQSRRSHICPSCLLHHLVARAWCCLMWLLLYVGPKEGHGNQFNAGWPKICLISLLVYDSLCFHPIYGLQHPTNLTWSCSSLISLFLAGLGCFVHSPPTSLLFSVRTKMKITKQIMINHLLIYCNSSYLTPEYPFQPTP